MAAQPAQELEAAHARHVEIEQDDERTVDRVALEHPHRLDPVDRAEDPRRRSAIAESAVDGLGIDVVVLDEQDRDRLALHAALPDGKRRAGGRLNPIPIVETEKGSNLATFRVGWWAVLGSNQ